MCVAMDSEKNTSVYIEIDRGAFWRWDVVWHLNNQSV